MCVFDALSSKCPDSKKYPHAARWFTHIQSYSKKERTQFKKAQKDAKAYLAAPGA